MTIFIVCHKDLPSFPPPEGSKIIWLNSKPPLDNRGMDVIAGYDFFSEPEELHAKLSGSLGTIAIAEFVSEQTAKASQHYHLAVSKIFNETKNRHAESRIPRDEHCDN